MEGDEAKTSTLSVFFQFSLRPCSHHQGASTKDFSRSKSGMVRSNQGLQCTDLTGTFTLDFLCRLMIREIQRNSRLTIPARTVVLASTYLNGERLGRTMKILVQTETSPSPATNGAYLLGLRINVLSHNLTATYGKSRRRFPGEFHLR